MCSGSELLCATDEERFEYYAQLAMTQRNCLTVECMRDMPKHELLSMVLPPGAVKNKNDWQQHHSEFASPGGIMMVDADQGYGTRGASAGSDFPVQLKHGHIFELREDPAAWRLSTGMEHFNALGFQVSSESIPSARSKMVKFLKCLHPHQQKLLAGNSMHIETMSSWMLYVLGNIVPVDVPLKDDLPRASAEDWDLAM